MGHYVRGLRPEKPLNRCPITLLIDDPTPCINPLYYFASQVPKDAVDYHYTKREGNWYFDSDTDFKFPISDCIDQEFVHEFADWVNSTRIYGKISVIPFPAGLGRVDRRLVGFPKDRVSDFILTFRDVVAQKFDVGPEMLTHTRALNVQSRKLKSGISEHDWSQKQGYQEITKYVRFALKILKSAGLRPSGVTSPCNFGMYVEGDYVRAILDAGTNELGLNVLWYFLNVDSKSLNVDHKLMYLDHEKGEAIVSIIGSMNDPFWTAQMTDLTFEDWSRERIDPILSADGKSGRIAEQVNSGSCVTIVTHWQSLYSNGSRYGLRGLDKLVSRINESLNNRVLWMRCTEISNYTACAAAVSFSSKKRLMPEDGVEIELSSPFECTNFTFSFDTDSVPSELSILQSDQDEEKITLDKVSGEDQLRPNSWSASEISSDDFRIMACVAKLRGKTEREINYGVTKKTKRTIAAREYDCNLNIIW